MSGELEGTWRWTLEPPGGGTQVVFAAQLTNAFYGESIRGTWKFKFLNFCPGQTLLSATQGQGIQFYGR